MGRAGNTSLAAVVAGLLPKTTRRDPRRFRDRVHRRREESVAELMSAQEMGRGGVPRAHETEKISGKVIVHPTDLVERLQSGGRGSWTPSHATFGARSMWTGRSEVRVTPPSSAKDTQTPTTNRCAVLWLIMTERETARSDTPLCATALWSVETP